MTQAKISLAIDGVQPVVDGLKQVSEKIGSVSGHLDQLGMSAKQTAAAMRMVPAQVTDIVVSLASGQKPMTVLLQQGGQLKDMFGGVGAAARGLATYVGGLINPLTLTAAAVGTIAIAYHQGSKEAVEYNKALILTGNAAGTTASQLGSMAQSISRSVGTQGAAAAALAEMAGTGKIAGQNLEYFSKVAVQMERVLGQSLSKTADQFADLEKSPVEAITKLNDQYKFLTGSVYRQIKALEDQGRAEEAAAAAQNAYARAFDSRTKEVLANLGLIERGWIAVKDGAKAGWDAILGVGRKMSPAEQIAEIQKQIEFQTKNKGGFTGMSDKALAAFTSQANARIEALRGIEYAELEAAAANKAASDKEQARIAWMKDTDKYLSKRVQMEREIAKAINMANAADIERGELQKRIAEIKEKYKEKGGESNNEIANLKAKLLADKQYLDLLKQQGIHADKLNEGEKLALELQEQLKGKLDAKTKARKEELLVLAQSRAAILKQIDDTKELLKAQEEFQKARDREKMAIDAEIVKLNEKAQAVEDEVAMYGLGRQAIESLTIARLEEKRAILAQFAGSADAVAQIEKEIEARKRLAKAMDAKEAKEAVAKEAKHAAEEWKRATDKIGDSLTDALMRGFESGKDFASNLRDTVVNMFKTLVLRPVISAVVNPIAGSITSALGGGTAGGGILGTITSGASLLQAGKSLFSGAGSGSLFGGSGLFGMFGSSASAGAAAGIGAADMAAGMLPQFGSHAAMASGMAGGGLSGAMSGIGAAISKIPVIGWIIAGMMKNASWFSQGWDPNNGTVSGLGKVVGGPSLIVDKLLQGLGMSVKTASILTGSALFSRAFGRKNPEVTNFGITGSVSSTGFDGQRFADILEKGGWFRSDKRYTNFSALDKEAKTALNASAVAMMASLNEMTDAIGLGADQIGKYNTQLRVSLAGVKEEELGAKIAAAFSGLSDKLVGSLIDDFRTTRQVTTQTMGTVPFDLGGYGTIDMPSLITKMETVNQTPLSTSVDGYIADIVRLSDAFKENIAGLKDTEGQYAAHVKALFGLALAFKENTSIAKVFGESLDFKKLESVAATGETVLDTFGRLNKIFEETNALATLLGKDASSAFGAVGLASTSARERIIALVGGLDVLAAGAAFFADNFLSASERMAPKIKAVTEQMAELGFAGVDTKDEFKNLVKSLDLSTESGATLYTKLIALAPAFAQVADYSQLLADEAVEEARNAADDAISKAKASADAQVKAAQVAEQARLRAIEDARSALVEAYNREADALKGTIEKFKQFSQSLRAFRDSLIVGNLSTLSPEQKYLELKSRFESTYSLAKAGDLTAVGDLQGVAQQFLEASQGYFASSDGYTRDFEAVKAAIDATVNTTAVQADIATQQLDALNVQVSGLVEINSSVLSVRNAILALQSAQAVPASVIGSSGAAADAITSAYVDNLYRAPKKAGFDYWMGRVNAGTSIDSVVSEIANSNEAKVQDLYTGLVGRVGEAEGVAYWTGRLNSGASLDQVRQEFLSAVDESMGMDGSHANGLDYVPFNGYRAELHEGERVKTASQARAEDQIASLLQQVILELRADKTQRGAAATETVERLEKVVDGLSEMGRKMARAEA